MLPWLPTQPGTHASVSLGCAEWTWVYLSSVVISTSGRHLELGPLFLYPDTCQQPLLLTFPGEKEADLGHAAWEQSFGNLPKTTHSEQVLAKSPTLSFNFPLTKELFLLKDWTWGQNHPVLSACAAENG